MLLLKVFLIITLICFVKGFQPPWMFMGRPLTGFRQDGIIDSINATEHKSFNQSLDHFSKNGTKWEQRYWKNDEFAKDDKELHFLILGGEYEASSFDIFYEKYPHVKYAKECNATLWLLEHRFYGKSQPFKNLETKNLKYLKSHQALADIAYFIKSQNEALNLINPKWIIFGGGYSGTLGIWFKKIYPDLSVGVVASSAPVNLRLDFYEYMQHVENLINSYDSECVKNVKDVFKDFTYYLRMGDKSTEIVGNTLKLNPSLLDLKYTYQDVGFLYTNIFSFIQASIQYNNANAFNNKLDIFSLCKDMQIVYPNFPYRNLANVVILTSIRLTGFFNEVDIHYTEFVSYLKNTDGTDPKQASTRAWLWQSCNEFGNFITTDGGKSIFGNYISYNFYLELCVDVFGPHYNMANIQNGLQKIKSNYGFNSDFTGSANIITTKNSYDPWSLLALKNADNLNITTYEIDDIGHCADMAPTDDSSDSEALKQYHEFVLEKIKEWIS